MPGQGARKIDYAGFERALPLLAAERGCACDEVRRAIVLSGGPRRNSAVKADAFVRLHDDKSTFTGALPGSQHLPLMACHAAADMKDRLLECRGRCHLRACMFTHAAVLPLAPLLLAPGRGCAKGRAGACSGATIMRLQHCQPAECKGCLRQALRRGCGARTCAGVYAKGGPSTVDKKITLATITDRSSTEKGMVHN